MPVQVFALPKRDVTPVTDRTLLARLTLRSD